MRSPDTARPRPDLGWLRHRRVEHFHIEYVKPTAKVASGPSLDLSPSLDLAASPDQSTTGVPSVRPTAHAAPRRVRPRTLPAPRVEPRTTAVLQGRLRTVTLTRVQSGVGQLRVSLARSASAGDLAMGLVCETFGGATHVVQRLGGAAATPETPLPLVHVLREGDTDTVAVDLRQVGRLKRALLYGFSPSVSVLRWDGVVVTTLHDGSRIEAPFDLAPLSGTVALLTLYNVHGELVLRAELEPFAGPPEVAAQAYGYHSGWLDGRMPVR